MKALLQTRCGCTRMMDIEDILPSITIPMPHRNVSAYFEQEGGDFSTGISYDKREFLYEDIGEIRGVKIVFYREIA